MYDRSNAPLPQPIQKYNQIMNSDLNEESKNKELNKVWEGHAPRAFMGKSKNGDVSVKFSAANLL